MRIQGALIYLKKLLWMYYGIYDKFSEGKNRFLCKMSSFIDLILACYLHDQGYLHALLNFIHNRTPADKYG